MGQQTVGRESPGELIEQGVRTHRCNDYKPPRHCQRIRPVMLLRRRIAAHLPRRGRARVYVAVCTASQPLVLIMDMKYDIIHHMKRTTIFITEALAADLQRHAKRMKQPVALVVREAVAEYLASRATPTPVPASLGMGKSGR